MSLLRYDSRRLGKVQRTQQGYPRMDANLTRVGVLDYPALGRKELRHPDEVFKAESLATAQAGLPVTIGHGAGLVTLANSRQVKVGTTVADAAPVGGRFVGAPVQIEDAQATARIDSGELVELSTGYMCDYDPTPGVWEGQAYDGVQRNIRYNHVALLPAGGGRAGSEVALRLDEGDAISFDTQDESVSESARTPDSTSPEAPTVKTKKIRLDGLDIEVPEAVADAYAALVARTAELEKNLGKAEATVAAVQVKLDAANDPKAVDARVAARVELVSQATKVLGAEFKADGKSDHDIRVAAIAKAKPALKLDGKTSDYVVGVFESVCEEAPVNGAHKSHQTVADALNAQRADAKDPAAKPEVSDAAKAYEDGRKAKAEAWKSPAK